MINLYGDEALRVFTVGILTRRRPLERRGAADAYIAALQSDNDTMTDDTTSAPTRLSGFLTIAAFCHWSGLCRTKVYGLIKQGDLRAVKCGRRTLITEAEAARWRDALPTLHASALHDIGKSKGQSVSHAPEASH